MITGITVLHGSIGRTGIIMSGIDGTRSEL
jgi:hypothetical protein